MSAVDGSARSASHTSIPLILGMVQSSRTRSGRTPGALGRAAAAASTAASPSAAPMVS